MPGIDLLQHSALVSALGWTLVHFLWQGLVLGLLFVLAERAASNGPAQATGACSPTP